MTLTPCFILGNSDRYVTKPVISTNINNFKHNRRTWKLSHTDTACWVQVEMWDNQGQNGESWVCFRRL